VGQCTGVSTDGLQTTRIDGLQTVFTDGGYRRFLEDTDGGLP
jgi:hypothetical protein